MRLDPSKPGLFGLLRGEGEPALQVIAWAAAIFYSVLAVAALIHFAGVVA